MQRSATPPQKTKPRLGRKEGENSRKKQDLAKAERFFSLGSSLGYAGGVEVLDRGTGVQMDVFSSREQGGTTCTRLRAGLDRDRRGMRALSNPVGQLNPHPATPTE